MLNFDVKRKINTLRDILVGKVPDPKAQVEQITIALIYKFMDDMDIDSVNFGGNREFFKGEYEKYAFSQLMLPEHSAQQRLNLYAEGIEKITMNPDLPQLFRDIFRGAYIPYRDPETLNMFLKEIAEFSYSNSEDLGNAFEYLLSIMSSQGDAGQFRTPRHIIDMMVDITAPQKNESILDPACGTAGFLISAFKYIEAHNRDESGVSTLTADDKNRMVANFAGYDISPDMVRLSRVNMYLHGFSKPPISEYDTLTSLDKWDDNYDVIFANPPFMTPKGGIIPHSRYYVSARRSEVLFVDYIAEHLTPTGRAAVIVPEGIVFQTANAYKNLRKYLVDDGLLYAVISLPTGVFNPYSGVKTSILLMDKTLARTRDSILFVKLNNDGFDLGAQRREIKGNEIPDVINIIQDYQKGTDVERHPNTILVKKKDIAEQDYILVGERYRPIVIVDTKWPMVKLCDVCELNPPKSELRGIDTDTFVSFVPMADLNEHEIKFEPKETRSIHEVYTGYTYFRDNDVLLAKVTPCFENGKAGIASNLCNGIGFGSSEYYVIRPNTSCVLSAYIYQVVSSEDFIEQGKLNMSGTGGLQRVTKDFVCNYLFPLPSLSVQKEIIEEIEGYQKIIDGAKQIVDNYKPTIKIDPEWDMVRLGNIASLKYGYTKAANDFGNARLIRITDISTDGLLNEKGEKYVDVTNDNMEFLLRKGDLLVARTGATYGKTMLFKAAYPAIYASFLIKIILPTDIIMNEYYWAFAQSSEYWRQANSLMTGCGQPQFNANVIKEIVVPLPPIETQREIVARINEEMSIVEQNKRLIMIFQQKIKDKIADVWG